MSPAPHDLLESVSDERSFLAFAKALLEDRLSAAEAEQQEPSSSLIGAVGGWENNTVESFLEAAIAWAEDSDMGSQLVVDGNNPWRRFALFLYCGKTYE